MRACCWSTAAGACAPTIGTAAIGTDAFRSGAERGDAAVLRGAEAGRRGRRDDVRHAAGRGALVRAAQGRAGAQRADGRSSTTCSRRRRTPTTSRRRRTCCGASASARWSSSSPISATRTAPSCGQALRLLRSRHLVLLASLRERIVGELIGAAAGERRRGDRRRRARTSTSSRAATRSTGSRRAMR